MARAFIFITFAMWIENAFFIIHKGILKARAEGHTLAPKALRLIE